MNPIQRRPFLLMLLVLMAGCVVPVAAQEYECTGIDGWLPVSGGLDGTTEVAAATDGDLLYFFARGDTGSGILSVWDETRMRTLSATGLQGITKPRLIVYRGMVYLYGMFPHVAGIENTRSLARWNGSAWESAGITGDSITSMFVYDDRLYVGGDSSLVINGSNERGPLAVYDGTRWRQIPVGYSPYYGESLIYSMAIYKGNLVVSGTFRSVDGATADEYAQFDGRTWSNLQYLASYGPATEMIEYKGGLYMELDFDRICVWDGDGITRVLYNYYEVEVYFPQVPTLYSPRSLAIHNGRLYSFGVILVPGSPTPLQRTSIAFDGQRYHAVSSVRQWAWPIEYRGRLYAYGRIDSSCGRPLHNLAVYCDVNTCARITGSVYRDEDGDCRHDPDEPGLAGRIVSTTPGPLYTTTDSLGEYSQFVPPGTYSVEPAPYHHWSISCTDSVPINLTLAPTEVRSRNDFAVAAIPGIYDMRVSIAGNRIRPGRPTNFIIHYANVGTEPAAGMVRFIYDIPALTFTSSSLPPTRVSDGSLEWEIPTLQPGEGGTIVVTMTPLTTLERGMIICANVSGRFHGVNEELADDNYDEVCTEVTGSYDPNDLSVSPTRVDFDYLRPEDTILSYQVRFQNTGNDTAFRVIIRDTLDRSLDIRTLSIGAASHRHIWRLEGENILVITFEEIYLPDSSANEARSHGVIKYRIHLRQPVASNVEIRNRVGIYFDYNAVVMTNEVISRTQEITSVPAFVTATSAMQVYPRPARDRLYIDGSVVAGSTMMLHRIDGTTVLTAVATGSGREQIDVGNLPSGVYLLKARTLQGTVGDRVVITR